MTQPIRKPNRLAREKSPYLLQHAHNPVDWFAWGEEAFEKAEKENRPIFLSVGYSTCHWCHVMERESFENADIAELLNQYFVPVKVDREELPDLDRLYMNYVQSTTGRGGWPMSVWLTPDRNPFYGGSYFPPEERYGMTGFKTILLSIANLWQSDEPKIREASSGFFSDLAAFSANRSAELPDNDEAQKNCFEWLESTVDPKFGGFGGAPKFPRPVLLNFLFNHAYHSGNQTDRKKALEMALFTLRKMAEGGIHDHISFTGKGGGGFARYSTDERWHVPHFEKMLYDNAQLASSYLDAFQCSGEVLYRSVVEDIFNYVLCDMTSPEGGFYSAEDADSLESESDTEKREGAFYIWSAEELGEIIGNGEHAAIFAFVYGVRAEGNALNDPHGEFTGRNILMQEATIEETAVKFGKTAAEIRDVLDEARGRLFTARSRRPRPFLDDKILTSWNALMISALAKGYRVLHHEPYLAAARKAAAFLLDTLYDRKSGRLLRRYRDGSAAIAGKVDDYAFFVQALLDLYEASFETAYLQIALEIAELQNTLFYDELHGGYFSSASDDHTVPVRQKESYDGAEPTANSISAMNLLRLGELTGKEEFSNKAEELFSSFGTTLASQSHALPQMLVALNFARKRRCRILFSGELHAPEMDRLRAVAGERYLPGTVVMHASAELAALQHVPEPIPHDDLIPQASVCIDRTCHLPVRDPEQLAELLDRGVQ
ncbi:MAG: thioredoxin domain-containing protein [Chlorobiaceae bacterium]|nr:thioredoxin domain-containing protein [Chlorobiaceae bacterium]